MKQYRAHPGWINALSDQYTLYPRDLRLERHETHGGATTAGQRRSGDPAGRPYAAGRILLATLWLGLGMMLGMLGMQLWPQSAPTLQATASVVSGPTVRAAGAGRGYIHPDPVVPAAEFRPTVLDTGTGRSSVHTVR